MTKYRTIFQFSKPTVNKMGNKFLWRDKKKKDYFVHISRFSKSSIKRYAYSFHRYIISVVCSFHLTDQKRSWPSDHSRLKSFKNNGSLTYEQIQWDQSKDSVSAPTLRLVQKFWKFSWLTDFILIRRKFHRKYSNKKSKSNINYSKKQQHQTNKIVN